MGCDIHAYLEVKQDDGSWKCVKSEIDFGRHYGFFGWLADVRNYSGVEQWHGTKMGVPLDMSDEVLKEFRIWHDGAHNFCWCNLNDLLSTDFDQIIWDRRVTRQIGPKAFDCGCTTIDPFEGRRLTLREFLGEWIMKEFARLGALQGHRPARLICWFDN
jgi:hypothetical protein